MARKPEVVLYKAVYEDYQPPPQPTGTIPRRGDRAACYRMVEVRVNVVKTVDLTDPAVQARYGVDRGVLTSDDHEPCRRLGRRLRAEGFEAVWTFSSADRPDGRCMVVFLNLLGPASGVQVGRLQAVDESEGG